MATSRLALPAMLRGAWARPGALTLGFVAVALAAAPPTDDAWGALATGRAILAAGALPRTDPFIYTFSGRWLVPAPGAAVLSALVGSLGELALRGVVALLGAAAVVVAAPRLVLREGPTARVAPWLALVVLALGLHGAEMATALSALVLAGVLRIMLRIGGGRPVPPYAPLALGAVAIQGTTAAVALPLVLVAAALIFALPPTPRGQTARAFLQAAGLVAAGLLVNPYGTALPLRLAREAWLGAAFEAHVTPAHGALAIVTLVAGAVTLRSASAREGRGAAAAVALALGLAATALRAEGALAVSLAGLALGTMNDDAPPPVVLDAARSARRALPIRGLAVLLAGATAFVFGGPSPAVRPSAVGDAARIYVSPALRGASALAFGPSGRAFAGPSSPPRETHLGEDAARVDGAEAGWDKLLAAYRADAVVVPSDAPLGEALGERVEWNLTHAGAVLIFVRRK